MRLPREQAKGRWWLGRELQGMPITRSSLGRGLVLWQTCEACVWIEHDDTQVVQTSWAAMALMYAKYPYTEPIAKAVALVMSRQLPVRGFSPAPCCPCNSFSGRLMGTRGH